MAQRCWLVTGGCGFIGSNLIRLILAERPDVRVVNVDALTYAGNVANLEGLPADQAAAAPAGAGGHRGRSGRCGKCSRRNVPRRCCIWRRSRTWTGR
jgi:hypothetical protein